MQDTATMPHAASADDARREILEATARLIKSDNTAIMPDGRIVPRGTPGAMAYESANRKPEPTMPPGMEGEPAWIPCPDCDDHWCNLHGMHTHECDCPPIDEWETDPYSPPGKRPAMPRPPIRVIMFRPEFEAPITAGTKHHTIRGKAKRPWKFPMLLSLRVWTGAPYRTPQREFMLVPLIRVEGIRIHTDGVELRPGTHAAFWMGEQGKRRDLLEAFARADGFESWEAMKDLFRRMRGIDREPFEGQLIRWKEPTR